MSENHTNSSGPELTLYVKAGQGGRGLGACPFCHQISMILNIKQQEFEGNLFEIVTIDIARPRTEFGHANRLPVLKHGDEVLTQNDEIVNYIEQNFPQPSLKYDNLKANAVCLDVFSKFSYYIKQVSHSPDLLFGELQRVNDHLLDSGTQYLAADKITNLDCLMLPKLHHIRVALEAFKDFRITSEMSGLWNYLRSAYQNKTFVSTCPSDQEIVFHWSSKQETIPLSEEKKRYYSVDGEPRFSFKMPA